MDIEMEIFPRLSVLPDTVSEYLQDMINCYVENLKCEKLKEFMQYRNIDSVFDSNGNVKCLFKRISNEFMARMEVAVYLLDHPSDGRRSDSKMIYGFSGVPPAVYIRHNEVSGVLVDFVQNDGAVAYACFRATSEELHKIFLIDIRFGNPDRHNHNTLVRGEKESSEAILVPIDHELCFSTKYTLRGFWWLVADGTNEPKCCEVKASFSPHVLSYVRDLDPEHDFQFLRHCGWEAGPEFSDPFTIFTSLLKKAVLLGLNAPQIGRIAARHCKPDEFNLQNMVDSVPPGDNFVQNVCDVIDKRLQDYCARTKASGSQTKKQSKPKKK
ncbi:Phosphatidylinositol 3-/4-kinase [Hirschfeldia incana]|nr:Phosphatidylinositol 3-/4-kinase [Hirschfeldia incana]